LLHVIDCYDEERLGHIEQVEAVLEEIGAAEVPVLQVYNKIDRMEGSEPRIDRDENGVPWRVWVSAVTGEGLDLLLAAISERLGEEMFHDRLKLGPRDGNLRAQLYAQGAVVQEEVDDQGEILLEVRLQMKDFKRILSRLGIRQEQYLPQMVD
jgi:GTP-binding protein HflX